MEFLKTALPFILKTDDILGDFERAIIQKEFNVSDAFGKMRPPGEPVHKVQRRLTDVEFKPREQEPRCELVEQATHEAYTPHSLPTIIIMPGDVELLPVVPSRMHVLWVVKVAEHLEQKLYWETEHEGVRRRFMAFVVLVMGVGFIHIIDATAVLVHMMVMALAVLAVSFVSRRAAFFCRR
ncbi:hypothetical protein ACCO45_004943 [Purpureocillium lilacinum]|uniref:Uncharacterized protein n=1 Tax=Purpureocillium lilacinum TaxID=33203 RepID=A0ACC4DU87_PURLI